MGTTLTAVRLEGETGHFVHIGDSRGYLLRAGELQQLTDDHSLVGEMMRDGRLTEEEAAVHPHRSVLSRALGTEAQVRIDEFEVDLEDGDVLLLCSDGLSGAVPAADIRKALGRDDPQDAASAAHRRGAQAAAAPTTSPPSSCASRTRRRPARTAADEAATASSTRRRATAVLPAVEATTAVHAGARRRQRAGRRGRRPARAPRAGDAAADIGAAAADAAGRRGLDEVRRAAATSRRAAATGEAGRRR